MKKQNGIFIWRITYSHVIAYFLAGLFALNFMNYREQYASASLSLLMKPVSDPIVALGPVLQIFRGIIIALVLLPIKKVFIDEKKGILKLALLIFGISSFSTIGPTPGSFDGIIYTILPIEYHLLGIPETGLYISLFCLFIWGSYKINRKYISVISIVIILLISIMGIMGFLYASHKL
jgi:hypothetical protein